jgi:Carboxypeptidase regulatory-like domain
MRRMNVLTLLVLPCLPLGLAAQTPTVSQISGTVHDPSGAAIPGAQVQITNVNTNAVRTTVTSAAGYYVFPSLAIGPYRLQVSKQGFTTYAQTGIVLQVNTNPTIDVTMQVGAVTQTVHVTANAAMVETQSTAGLGQVIQPEQVVDLPLNGRQATQLIALSGAAVNTGGSGGIVNTLDYPTAVSISRRQILPWQTRPPHTTSRFVNGDHNRHWLLNIFRSGRHQDGNVEPAVVPE